MSLLSNLAHPGGAEVVATDNALHTLLHQPTWIGLLMVAATLAAIHMLSSRLKVTPTARLLIVLASSIVIGVLYVPHNPSITAIVLSVGFIATFALTFTQLGKIE